VTRPDCQVGIVVLDYHQPEATLACVRSLLAAEGPETRILWIENDADTALAAARQTLAGSGLAWVLLDPGRDPLPPAGTIGLIPVARNLGYGGGNNVGLRYLHGQGVPYAWVLNNDSLLEAGCSRLLVAAAQGRPEVGLWGTAIRTGPDHCHCGGRIQTRDFAAAMVAEPADLDGEPLAFVSGCSMFLATATAQAAGWIPEDFFLYYEDLAFNWEVRRLGLRVAALATVRVQHLESLSTGRRSRLTEFYNRRNRWLFIQRYFPEQLPGQQRRFLFYQVQKRLLALKFSKLALEWQAWRAFKRGVTGPQPGCYS
jgi:GT2 family glycosyltransferase